MQKHLQEHHQNDEKELILHPYSYAFVLDRNSGEVKTFTGPTTYTMTPNDIPVTFSQNRFSQCRLDEAIKSIPIAVEGFYLVVLNPSQDGSQCKPGQRLVQSPELDVGRRINVHGPVVFTPWPGQMTEVIRGHHLRSNEYLIVKVYNEEEARQNWGTAVIKPAISDDGEVAPVPSISVPEDLSVGKHYVIKGTEVSFYMPPTGVSVVPLNPEMTSNAPAKFVRQALTLEVLEYSILVDEDGNKRYERGPCVVFPRPTERFIEKDGRMKFRAIELNEIQGLHVKVIAPYTDENGVKREEGDELFITGKDTAIYYPREEHSSISYDGKTKHFATAIPAGEGRYLMDRITGEIGTKKGPMMLLPDPRNQVIVRRVLSKKQCELWYPGNDEALEYNMSLAGIAQSVPTTRSGAISDGDYERSTRSRKKGMDKSLQHRDQKAVMDEISRSSTYSQPRTVTFDNKFSGVPRIDVWTGYAIMVVSATGERHVVEGPATVLLGYDETLEAMALSTGKPKTTDVLHQDVFLRVKNNNISDYINDAETCDHVKVSVKVIYTVDFEGDKNKWWDIENYVKHVTDHVRSVVKGAIKKVTIEDFYSSPVDFIRDIILGKSAEGTGRAGMVFENGARIKDVEIMKVRIQDERIQSLLDATQHQVVKTNIELAQKRRDLEVTLEMEKLDRDKTQAKKDTEVFNRNIIDSIEALKHDLEVTGHKRAQEVLDLKHAEEMLKTESKLNIAKVSMQSNLAVNEADMEMQRRKQALELQNMEAATEAMVQRATCIQPQLAHDLKTFSETIQMKSVMEGFGEFAAIQGKGVSETMKQVMDFLPQNLRVLIPSNGDVKQLKD